MKKLFKPIVFFLSSILIGQYSFAQDTAQAVTAWLKKNSLPIKHLNAGTGFADLQPLKQVLKDVKIVALGESTHGTREMFQLKHRLLEFLVTEMGFNVFALEASYAACQPINDYVLHGKGDLSTVLTSQNYVVWDTEEMAEMIAWMREYNKKAPEQKKVKFYGVDLSNNENGRKMIISYLKKVAPERVAATDSFFRVLYEADLKFPFQIDSAVEKTLQHIQPNILDLIDYLTANKEKFAKASSLEELNQALWYAEVMKQFIMAHATALRPPFVNIRAIAMAANLMYLIDNAGPEGKFVVWEHNSHISRDGGQIGIQLRNKYNKEYYAFSIEFNQGSFQRRSLLPNKLLGDFKPVNVPPGPVGSLPWYLSRTGLDNLYLNLRIPVSNAIVDKWLNSPQKVYDAGWVHFADSDFLKTVEVMRSYDGIIFIDKTTPTRPTSNALKSASSSEGL